MSDRGKMEFNIDCRKVIIFFLKKINMKSPLNYNLTLNLACLNPQIICNSPDEAEHMFQKCCSIIVSKYMMKAEDADGAVEDFGEFLDAEPALAHFCSFFWRSDAGRSSP